MRGYLSLHATQLHTASRVGYMQSFPDNARNTLYYNNIMHITNVMNIIEGASVHSLTDVFILLVQVLYINSGSNILI